MSDTCCKDCGVSLDPRKKKCPVCGAEADFDSDIDISVNEEYLDAVNNQVPENYPGY
ncbi:MAG: hypothetical protein MI863_08865 [Desulfobacterales bacterium]|nr:hypothetical protein [Desulfobacterales bacterium]